MRTFFHEQLSGNTQIQELANNRRRDHAGIVNLTLNAIQIPDSDTDQANE
ncbi:hypothetical protein PCA20602_00642 [Pandoraea capi]|uniref:Uncharacterized protein n=1 Tax=Pandoraea capi TaxID=2508286 RepID=A0ABY6VP79_9BURK|nr:hypothetical protein PCA20602_00642 [Pandoraea capi]